MKKRQVIVLILLLSIFACTSDGGGEYKIHVTKRRLPDSISMSEKQIRIKLINNDISNYSTNVYSHCMVDGLPYLALYNNLYHSIDIFNFADLIFEKRVSLSDNILSRWERSRFNPVNSIFLRNFDSIFILTIQNLLIIDTSETVLFKYYINQKYYTNKKGKNVFIYRNKRDFPIYFDPLARKIYLPQYNATASSYSKKYFESELEAIFNLKDSTIATLPVTFPAFFKTGFYSRTGNPSRIINGDLNIYTFELDPNIYVYNRKTHTNIIEGGRSKFQAHSARPFSMKTVTFDRDREMNYITTSFSYGHFLYDQFRKLYYRFYFQEQPLKNKNGFYNTIFDRREVLMVFNEKFEVIGEFVLQLYKYNCNFSFVTSEGLIVSNYNPLNPKANSAELGFYVISISNTK